MEFGSFKPNAHRTDVIQLMRLVALLVFLATYCELGNPQHLQRHSSRRWSGLRDLRAPFTLHLHKSGIPGSQRSWCNNMSQTEELHGQWEASENAPGKAEVNCAFQYSQGSTP